MKNTNINVVEAQEIAEQIKASETWDDELNERLCELAGLDAEYMAADGDTFTNVVFRAAEILTVEIL